MQSITDAGCTCVQIRQYSSHPGCLYLLTSNEYNHLFIDYYHPFNEALLMHLPELVVFSKDLPNKLIIYMIMSYWNMANFTLLRIRILQRNCSDAPIGIGCLCVPSWRWDAIVSFIVKQDSKLGFYLFAHISQGQHRTIHASLCYKLTSSVRNVFKQPKYSPGFHCLH